MKKILSVVLVVVCLCSLVGCSKSNNDAIEQTTEVINSIETVEYDWPLKYVPAYEDNDDYLQLNEQNRIQNQGSFLVENGWIYGQSWDKNGESQFVKTRTDYKDWTVLDNGFAKFIYVIDGYIYYMKSGSKEYGIFKMKQSGSGKKLIAKAYGQMQIVYNTIYYIDCMVDGKHDDTSKDDSNYHLYRCDLNGKNKKEIIAKPTFCFFVFDDAILYQDDRDKMSLHICDLEGKNDIKINDQYSFCPIYDGEYIYYMSSKNANDKKTVWRVRPDGSENKQVAKIGVSNALLIKGDYIYFVNEDDGDRIYRMNKNGKDIMLITQDANVTFVQFFNETLKYTKYTKDYKYIDANYFAEYDGSGKYEFES